jgi:hypothetical protein
MLLSYGIRREAIFAGRDDVLAQVRGRQSERWQLNDTIDMMRHGGWQAPPRHPAPGQQAAPAPATDDPVAQLRALAGLKDQGALTDAEFSAQKARILGTG